MAGSETFITVIFYSLQSNTYFFTSPNFSKFLLFFQEELLEFFWSVGGRSNATLRSVDECVACISTIKVLGSISLEHRDAETRSFLSIEHGLLFYFPLASPPLTRNVLALKNIKDYGLHHESGRFFHHHPMNCST